METLKHIFLLLLFAFFTTPAFAYQECPDGNGYIGQDANLRTGPGTNYQIITPLLKDTKVQTTLRQGKWLKVEAIDLQKSGWVHFSLVKNKPCHKLSPTKTGKIIKEQRKRSVKSTEKPTSLQANSPISVEPASPKKAKGVTKPAINIGVIDIQRVINQSQRGKTAREQYEELRRSAKKDNIDRAEEEIISKVIIEIQAIVETYALEQGFTHVLNKNSGSIFYSDMGFNITDDIIKEYDRQVLLHQTTL